MSLQEQRVAALGRPVDRVDGRLKVTGAARYAAEFPVECVTYAALIMSTIASGRIRDVDTRAAERAPGVLAVLSHLNAPRLQFSERWVGMDPRQVDDHVAPVVGRTLPVLQDDTIEFNGQPVAVI